MHLALQIILQGVVKQRDAERERLRKELHRLREQCHERNSLHGHVEDNTSTLDSIQSGDLESIEVRVKELKLIVYVLKLTFFFHRKVLQKMKANWA